MDDVALDVLRKYPRAVLALRGAFRDAQLGLMLGAGVSRAFDFSGARPPSWDDLVCSLERVLEFDEADVVYSGLSLTQRVEILFRAFMHKEAIDPADAGAIAVAHGRWRDLVREYLYDGAPPAKELVGCHPFMAAMLNLVLQGPMTVTYNFDSYLEECLGASPTAAAGELGAYRRPFESISDVTLPQRRSRAVIYHINGYLPRNPMEPASDHLVFSEGEFSSQLMMAMAGRYATVAHHLVNNVYLLIGLSVDDPNLRHQLRTNSIISPGRVHFVVRHVREPREPAKLTEGERGVAEAGFDLHNLYSLYLTSEEISGLCRLIAMDAPSFGEHANAVDVETKLVYYLSGIPGIGKTTVLRHMGGLYSLDEWVETPHELLVQPHSQLIESERDALDRWIASQFKLKNEVLRSFDEGIFIVERGPLDPLAFEVRERVSGKARTYSNRLDTTYRPLQGGQVVVLHGDTGTVERRISNRQAAAQRSAYLEGLQVQLRETYRASETVEWRSTDWSIETLVRQFSSLVYNGPYQVVDLQSRICNLAQ